MDRWRPEWRWRPDQPGASERPPEALPLAEDEVVVQRTALDLPAAEVEGLVPVLAADERARAGRYRFERNRRRFVVARAWLRSILGRYLAVRPDCLCFRYDAGGKPHLAGVCGRKELCFNLSHSDDLALCAVAWNRQVGIDLERVRPGFACAEVAAQFFSRQELEALRKLSPALYEKAFFTIWTRKEAYLKACGPGLAGRLDRVVVWPVPEGPALLTEEHRDGGGARCWSLLELEIDPGYVAALAVEACPEPLRLRMGPVEGGATESGSNTGLAVAKYDGRQHDRS